MQSTLTIQTVIWLVAVTALGGLAVYPRRYWRILCASNKSYITC